MSLKDMTHANHIGYSDIHPFEIVRHVSDKTLEVRRMNYKRDREFTPNIIAGGFAGYCTNNSEHEQKWIITSDEAARVIRIRLHKDGCWKDSNGNRYIPDTKPRCFYDYNF